MEMIGSAHDPSFQRLAGTTAILIAWTGTDRATVTSVH
jgi:hypothetical protein